MGTKYGEGRLEAWSVGGLMSPSDHKESHSSGTGDMKIQGSSSISEMSGEWKYVCGDKWDTTFMSHAACHRLGYKRAVETFIRDEIPSVHGHSEPRHGGNGGSDSDHHDHVAVGSKTFFYKGRNEGCGRKSDLAVYLTCEQFECGRNFNLVPSARIVGGTESLPGRWPWLVGLHGGSDEIFFCGGVLISEHWILSGN